MTTWKGKELSELSDNELRDAILDVATMDKFRVDKLSSPKKRHAKLFTAHPPTENPVFTNLAINLNTEFRNRKLTNV